MGIELIEQNKDVTRLVLKNGRGNPLSPALLEELNQAMDDLILAPPKVLIIDAAGSSVFSGGFALPIIASWPRKELESFFNRFLAIIHKILRIDSFTMTVLEGSAVAGGFILTLASDIRIVGSGKARFGLPEVDLGVSVPAGAGALLEWRTSPRAALLMASTGKLIDAQTAIELGYASHKADDPLALALELADKIAQKPGSGVSKTRRYFNHRVREAMKETDALFMEDFLDSWFSPEGQACIQAQAKRLSSKK